MLMHESKDKTARADEHSGTYIGQDNCTNIYGSFYIYGLGKRVCLPEEPSPLSLIVATIHDVTRHQDPLISALGQGPAAAAEGLYRRGHIRQSLRSLIDYRMNYSKHLSP